MKVTRQRRPLPARALRAGCAAALPIGLGTLGACAAAERVCPAIGWMNTLTIEVGSSPYALSAVVPCLGDTCSTDEAFDDGLPVMLTAREGDVWFYDIDMRAPDEVTLHFVDEQGVLRETREAAVIWESPADVGGCGGPGNGSVTVSLAEPATT